MRTKPNDSVRGLSHIRNPRLFTRSASIEKLEIQGETERGIHAYVPRMAVADEVNA